MSGDGLITLPLADLAVGAFEACQRARMGRDAVAVLAWQAPSRLTADGLATSERQVEILAQLHALVRALAPYERILRARLAEAFGTPASAPPTEMTLIQTGCETRAAAPVTLPLRAIADGTGDALQRATAGRDIAADAAIARPSRIAALGLALCEREVAMLEQLRVLIRALIPFEAELRSRMPHLFGQRPAANIGEAA